MNQPLKVVWSEGMLLTPQHFQQADCYYETLLSERLQALSPFVWGFTELEIDPDALTNGNVAVLRCHGVMSDGFSIRAPEHDPLPLARSMEGLFSPSLEHLDVFLGVPMEHAEGPNCQLDDTGGNSSAARYFATNAKVRDQITGEVGEILVARKNLRLFLSEEEVAGYITVKIAELVRTHGGSVALRETYIPPCLTVSASPMLVRLIRGLLEVLTAKRN